MNAAHRRLAALAAPGAPVGPADADRPVPPIGPPAFVAREHSALAEFPKRHQPRL